ncbi:PQQ-binding-like beta-propeller repeat protein [Streptomyces sp. NPDC002896]|uniref:outer membrane protein assembly factor BamB family protein n=1 Tax=Streptomyces sp. NPDC002896 TaxID=3154438 RepID=UPI00332A1EA4
MARDLKPSRSDEPADEAPDEPADEALRARTEDEDRAQRAALPVTVTALVAVLLAGALLCWAVMYGLLGMKLMIFDMPSRECSGSDCPRGMLPVWLLAVAFGFAFAPMARFAWKWAEKTLSSRGMAVVAALGVLAAVWPGWLGYAWLRGPHMDVAWEVGRDRPSSVRVLGYWAPDSSTVVRARSDGLRAYDTAQGKVRWSFSAPARFSVCALSRTTPSGVGLVGFGRHNESCGTSVAAVDLASGRTLWTKTMAPSEEAARSETAVLTSAGSTAVARRGDAIVGLALRDGSERWRLDVPRNCEARNVEAAEDWVLVVEECADESFSAVTMQLSAVDAQSGRRLWRSELPTGSPAQTVQVLSADPIALYVAETDERGTNGVVTFDDTGHQRAVIPVSGPDEDLAFMPYGTTFATPTGVPLFQAVVSRGLFITVAKDAQDRPQGLSAYSLTDGRRVWHTSFEDRIVALSPGRSGEVDVVTSMTWNRLWSVDARSGDQEGEAVVLRDAPLSDLFDVRLRPHSGYVFVNLDEDSDKPALFAVD